MLPQRIGDSDSPLDSPKCCTITIERTSKRREREFNNVYRDSRMAGSVCPRAIGVARSPY
jgi:hypothetical protein